MCGKKNLRMCNFWWEFNQAHAQILGTFFVSVDLKIGVYIHESLSGDIVVAMGQILFCVVALLVLSSATNVRAERRCPAQTTLATFNPALNPFYGLPNFGDAQLEERLSLLIEEVCVCVNF